MRRALVVICSLLLFFAAATPAMAWDGDGGRSRGELRLREGAPVVPGEIVVKFREGAGGEALDALKGSVRVTASERPPFADFERLEVEAQDFAALEAAINRLRASGLVEYAEPNFLRSADADYNPDDPYYQDGTQWNFNDPVNDGDINMPPAWGVTKGSPTIITSILDTGVAYRTGGGYTQAPDLALTNFVQGYDFINNDAYADDDHGHGTHVCGTVAQSTNNTLGCAGIAFESRIMPVKVLNQDGVGPDSVIAQGIRFAADQGGSVLNLSLSGLDPSQVIEEAVDYAASKGCVICCAAGNDGLGQVGYPAAYPVCIAIGATTRTRTRASYSNYGAPLDVVAPGGQGLPQNQIWQQTYVVTGDPSSGFDYLPKTGTSMACPHVTGVATLVKSLHPAWNAYDINGVIAGTCRDIGAAGWDSEFGFGLIDASAAVMSPKMGLSTPVVSSVDPAYGTEGQIVDVTVTGSNLTLPGKVVLERTGELGVAASDVTGNGSTQMTCKFDLAGVQPGLWDLVVENVELKSGHLSGGFVVDSANGRTWYLAEGSTAWGYEEFILLQNPGTSPANAAITFMTPQGPSSPVGVYVPPQSRTTVNCNDMIPNTDISAEVVADQDVIVERAMYWSDRVEGTDCIGVEAPSYTWYLAEGTTRPGFDTYLLIQNPTAAPAEVSVTYMTPGGPVDKSPFVIDGNTRYSIHVNEELPDTDVSFRVVASQRVIAERSMYWDNRRGGHDSVGTTAPAQTWYLAEGSTGSGFSEFVMLQNPQEVPANITITYMTPEGPQVQPAVGLAAGSRMTIKVNDVLPDRDVSVMAEADVGIVAERAMYWDYGTGRAGHGALGVPQPRAECFLAEGTTDWGFEEWVLVQNPNDTEATVNIEYMTSAGPVGRTAIVVGANSRKTIRVNDDLPPIDVSTKVSASVPVIAERAMYWHDRGAGHDSTGLMK